MKKTRNQRDSIRKLSVEQHVRFFSLSLQPCELIVDSDLKSQNGGHSFQIDKQRKSLQVIF